MTYRFEFYGALRERTPEILQDADRIRATAGILDAWAGRIGISGRNSSAPGTLENDGTLAEPRMRAAVRALFEVLESVQNWADRVLA